MFFGAFSKIYAKVQLFFFQMKMQKTQKYIVKPMSNYCLIFYIDDLYRYSLGLYKIFQFF